MAGDPHRPALMLDDIAQLTVTDIPALEASMNPPPEKKVTFFGLEKASQESGSPRWNLVFPQMFAKQIREKHKRKFEAFQANKEAILRRAQAQADKISPETSTSEISSTGRSAFDNDPPTIPRHDDDASTLSEYDDDDTATISLPYTNTGNDELCRRVKNDVLALCRLFGCHYVSPATVQGPGASIASSAIRATGMFSKFLFPMSYHGIGICPPNTAVELVFYASMRPQTFFHMAEELLAGAGFRFTRVKREVKLQTKYMRAEYDGSAIRGTHLRIEKGGRVILLEYCSQQTPQSPDNVSDRGEISSSLAVKNIAMGRARFLQKAYQSLVEPELDQFGVTSFEMFRDGLIKCFAWAHNSGMLSERLDLLTHELLFMSYKVVHDAYLSGPTPEIDDGLRWDQFGPSDLTPHPHLRKLKNFEENAFGSNGVEWEKYRDHTAAHVRWAFAALAKVTAGVTGGQCHLVDTPYAGLDAFRQTHSFIIQIKVINWLPGNKSTFYDAFFDVVAHTVKWIQKQNFVDARAWPFYLSDPDDDENSEASFLIAVWKRGDPAHVVKKHNRDIILEVMERHNVVMQAVEQFLSTKWPHHYEASHIILTEHSNEDYKAEDEPIRVMRHVGPVDGLSEASLPKTEEGQTDMVVSEEPEDEDTDEDDVSEDHSQGPFRTAKSAMSRLRWDPVHRREEYEVGYLDRFESDLMWKPLAEWESTVEEEEFIPLHRVRQLRKEKSKKVVWDREQRIDLLG